MKKRKKVAYIKSAIVFHITIYFFKYLTQISYVNLELINKQTTGKSLICLRGRKSENYPTYITYIIVCIQTFQVRSSLLLNRVRFQDEISDQSKQLFWFMIYLVNTLNYMKDRVNITQINSYQPYAVSAYLSMFLTLCVLIATQFRFYSSSQLLL